MSDSLNEFFWSANSIAEQWIKEGQAENILLRKGSKCLSVRDAANGISKRFGRICEKYFGEDEKLSNWYQSESVGGKYLFGDGAPELMRDLFFLIMETKGGMLEDDKDRIAECLTGLLPFFRSKEEVKSLKKYLKEHKIKWERESHSLLDTHIQLFERGSMDKALRNGKVKKIIERESSIKEDRDRIHELLDSYYIGQAMGEVYHNRIFVEADMRKGRLNNDFYWYQYGLVREWADKWYFIMENASAVRIAERFESAYGMFVKDQIEPQERKKFYKIGKIPDSMPENIHLGLDGCLPKKSCMNAS